MIRPETPADAGTIAVITTDSYLLAPNAAHNEAFIVNVLSYAVRAH